MTTTSNIIGWFKTEALIAQLDEQDKVIFLELMRQKSFSEKEIAQMAFRIGGAPK